MHRSLSLLLVFFFAFAADTPSDAGPIGYEQIPAEATGYIHIDFCQLVDSSIWKAAVRPADQARFLAILGGKCDVTAYTIPAKGGDATVLVWHLPDADVRKRIESRISSAGPTTLPSALAAGARNDLEFTSLRFTYHGHQVYYAKIGLPGLLSSGSNPPQTQPGGPTTAPLPWGQGGAESWGSLGQLVGGQGAQVNQIIAGPLYIAFVKPDLMISATDLPYMARALDVLDGKQPSLATRDPLGMKTQPSPGAMIEAAGVDTNPMPAAGAASATMTRLSFGEEQKNLYCDATLTMPNNDSADQLKNMIEGLKMIGSAAQPDAKPLFDPIEASVPATPPGAQAAQKDVLIHWSWPTEKSPQLVALVRHLITQMNQPPAKLPGGGQGKPQGFGSPQ